MNRLKKSELSGAQLQTQLIAGLSEPWRALLKDALSAPSFTALCEFLAERYGAGALIYPAPEAIFAALNATAPASVRVVILGQDPYHTPGAAHGLSFSVPADRPIPPSLVNIFKEIEQESLGPVLANGDLRVWTEQGVLLLNRVLTVEDGAAGSHQKRGWEAFTEAVLRVLAARAQPLAVMLWGAQAQQLAPLFTRPDHLVLKAPHPSPLSAYRGFFGCGHFRATNNYLAERGLKEIVWGADTNACGKS